MSGFRKETDLLPRSCSQRYRIPSEFKRDEQIALFCDRDFPNINSLDYVKRPINRQAVQHQAWEAVARNENGLITIATNKMSGRQFANSLWGYEKVTDFSPETAVFKTQRKYLVTNLEYCNPNNLLISYNSGHLELASIVVKLSARDEEIEENWDDLDSTMVLLTEADVVAHDHPIVSLEVMKSNKNCCITGDKNGGLKVLNVGENGLESSNSWEFAHLHSIKGIASSPVNESLFATCSLDKSVFLWDIREVRPAIALLENHTVRFTSLFWFDENTVYSGDESGYLHAIDIRQPKKTEISKKISQKPFHKLIPNGSLVAVISDSNIFKVFDLKNQTIIYENKDAQHFLRDGVWIDDKQFLVTSFEKQACLHTVL